MRVSANVYWYHSVVTGNSKMPVTELFQQVAFLSEFCVHSGTEWVVCSWTSKCMLYREVQLLSCCTERCSCCHIVQRSAAVVVLYREMQLLSCCTERCICCRVVWRSKAVVMWSRVFNRERKQNDQFLVLHTSVVSFVWVLNIPFVFTLLNIMRGNIIQIYTYFFFADFA